MLICLFEVGQSLYVCVHGGVYTGSFFSSHFVHVRVCMCVCVFVALKNKNEQCVCMLTFWALCGREKCVWVVPPVHFLYSWRKKRKDRLKFDCLD